jgi:hypothetical protein
MPRLGCRVTVTAPFEVDTLEVKTETDSCPPEEDLIPAKKTKMLKPAPPLANPATDWVTVRRPFTRGTELSTWKEPA